MEQLIDQLVNSNIDSDNTQILDSIYVFLRDEQNRDNQYLRVQFCNILEKFIQLTCIESSFTKESQLSNFIKLWVNFVAENQENVLLFFQDLDVVRNFHDQLQKIIIESNDTIKSLAIVFLSNLGLEGGEILEEIGQRGYVRPLLYYACHLQLSQKGCDDFKIVSDLLQDYTNKQNPMLDLEELTNYTDSFERFIMFDPLGWDTADKDEETEEESIVICAKLVSNLLKGEHFVYDHSTTVQQSISNLCETAHKHVRSKELRRNLCRHLFDAMGQLSSDTQNTNKHELSFNIEVIEGDDYQSPYVIASSFITLGNSINGSDDKINFYNSLKNLNTFIQLAMNKFKSISTQDDPIFLQGIHFFNQIWDVQLWNVLLKDWDSFITIFDRYFTVDITTYYQQISLMMCKFIAKLIASLGKESSLLQDTSGNELSILLNGSEFKLFDHIIDVLTVIAEDPSKNKIKHLLETSVFLFIVKISTRNIHSNDNGNLEKLISILLKINELKESNLNMYPNAAEVPFDYIFEKVKAIATLLSSQYAKLLVGNYKLKPVLENLKEVVLFSSSQTDETHITITTLVNNLKFIGAKLLSYFDEAGIEEHELLSISHELVAIHQK